MNTLPQIQQAIIPVHHYTVSGNGGSRKEDIARLHELFGPTVSRPQLDPHHLPSREDMAKWTASKKVEK